ncbi:MAG: cyclopropane-fatty-acyl-phospholipid synthase family protein [Pseudomonadota bacterium]
MNTTTFHRPAPSAPARGVTRLLAKHLEKLRHGTLSVEFPDGARQRFGQGEPHASISLHSWSVFTGVMARGDIGLAESWIAGDWSTPNLPDLMALLVRNRAELGDAVHGSWLGQFAARVRHAFHRNSRAGSRRNIHAHYDLGNAFYRLWLDETMNYSSACFDGDLARPLSAAQDAKTRRVLTMAGVRPGDRVLEIGCGWGALAEMAACEFGAHVTGVTLSTEQLAFARQRLASAGAADRADLRLQDYRDIQDAQFDAICSIEMVEAVGRDYWPTYFQQVSALLKPGGRACIQSIVMDDALWPRYIRGTDFIQQYIFPGGCLPCPREFERQARAAGLEVTDRYSFGADYAHTLRLWRERFMQRRTEVLALGFDERFIRLWEFYLVYCEAAFEQRNTDVVQYTLQKRS